jgi:hypothetical protein
MTSYGNQHFEDGEVYLDGVTDPEYLDTNGYPDAAELLYYHSPTGHYVEENFADGKKKGKSRPGRVKRSGASCNGSVTALRKRAKNSSGEKAKMYHWCANMKGGKKKKKAKESLADLEYYRQRRKERSKISPEELEKRTFEKFAKIHGEDKARAMIFRMKQGKPNYFIDKAKQNG